jgi:hypothetical protein
MVVAVESLGGKEAGVRGSALAKRAAQTVGGDAVWPAGAAVPGQVAPTRAPTTTMVTTMVTSWGGGERYHGTGRGGPG